MDYEEIHKQTCSVKKQRTKEFQEALEKQSRESGRQEQELRKEGKQGGAWSKVHSTHKRCLLKGILYCSRCGRYSIGKVEGRAVECTGPPSTSFQKAQLKKLSEGRHPVRGAVSWPDGSSSVQRGVPVRIDRYQ